MTMLRQLTWGLLATGALTLTACSEQAVAPNDGPVSGEMLAAKGGGGKPGGGGGGGGGGGTVASAEIAFHYNGALWVMNADGTARTALLTNGCSTTSSSWAPVGNGTTAAPFRILNWGNCASEAFTLADVDTTGGSVHVRNIQHIHIAGDWWDTGNAGSPHYGQPAWKPGSGDDIVLSASWQADPVTNEWVSALYIFATTELPNPTPQLLYQAPSGCTDAVRPAWSPDGAAIAFVEACGAAGDGIKVLDRATGGVTTVLASGVLDGFGPLDWSPSGEQLAFSAGGSVYTLRLTPGATPVRVASGFGASWSPGATDGRLAFNTTRRSKVSVIDFLTGNTTSLGSGEQAAWRR
jgi:hypothetical protein